MRAVPPQPNKTHRHSSSTGSLEALGCDSVRRAVQHCEASTGMPRHSFYDIALESESVLGQATPPHPVLQSAVLRRARA